MGPEPGRTPRRSVTVVRAVVFGLLAAVVAAAVVAAFTLGSKHDFSWMSWLLGLVVAGSVVLSEPRMHPIWVAVLSVSLTLLGLLLSEYLVDRFGDYEPIWSDPLSVLFFWGPPLGLACGAAFVDLSDEPGPDPNDGTDLDTLAPSGAAAAPLDSAVAVPSGTGRALPADGAQEAADDEVLEVPDRVVLRGRSWWYFTPGLLAIAGFTGYYAVDSSSFYDTAADAPAGWFNSLLIAACVIVAPLSLIAAVRTPRGGIYADRSTVRVVNMLRTRSLTWDQVRSIDFNETGWNNSDEAIEWTLAFRTSEARRGTPGYTSVTSSFPRGSKDPDGRVGAARRTLLAMQAAALREQAEPPPTNQRSEP